jgi:cation diffusion facilitator family transporter
MAGNSSKAVIVAFFINLAIAVIKFLAYVFSGFTAKSMFAESFHSVADSINQLFLLVGMKSSVRPADEKHQFGYGKERYFWSFVVGLGIFLIGGVVAIYEGTHKIIEVVSGEVHAEAPVTFFGVTFASAWLSIIILGISVGLEGYSWFVAMTEFKKTLGGRTLFKAVDESRDPTLVAVLFEDSAALFGLVLALIGVSLSHFLHMPILDGVFAILIGLLLVVCAYYISRISKALLIGVGATKDEEEKIRKTVEASPNVEKLINMETVYFGPDAMLVCMKVDFVDSLGLAQLEGAINEVEKRVRNEVPSARDIYVEADTFRKALQKAEKADTSKK